MHDPHDCCDFIIKTMPTECVRFAGQASPPSSHAPEHIWDLELSNELIDTLIDHARAVSCPQTEIVLTQLAGVVTRVGRTDSAHTCHEARIVVNVRGRWSDPARDRARIMRAREPFLAATESEHASGLRGRDAVMCIYDRRSIDDPYDRGAEAAG